MENWLNGSSVISTSNNPPSRMFQTAFQDDELIPTSAYRIVPLRKTFEGLKVSPVRCENVSGVREVERMRRISLSSNMAADTSETSVQANTKARCYSNRKACPEKAVQNTISKPAVVTVKDRGDATGLADEISTVSPDFGDGQPGDEGFEFGNANSNKHPPTGCVLLNINGRIYKSFISPIDTVSQDNIPSGPNLRKGESTSDGLKDEISAAVVEFAKQACGDFDVAIFLKGVNKPTGDPPRIQDRPDRKADESARKKHKLRHEVDKCVLPILGRSLESAQSKYESLKNNLDVNHPSKANLYKKKSKLICSPNSRYRMTNSYHPRRDEVALSSASECESVHRPPTSVQRDSDFIFKSTGPRGFRWNKQMGDACSNKSSEVSQASRFRDFEDTFPIAKIGDEELFDLFDRTFRRYASTSLHSGNVIPRRISTVWMVNAGIVDDYLSRKEADDAFRRAAGAKITMNAKEYKQFLIMLTHRLKLPYYEIYRRMCGLGG